MSSQRDPGEVLVEHLNEIAIVRRGFQNTRLPMHHWLRLCNKVFSPAKAAIHSTVPGTGIPWMKSKRVWKNLVRRSGG